MVSSVILADKTINYVTFSSEEIQYRLLDGRHAHEGRVEIRFDGNWGTVCSNQWDAIDALVLCRQLGLPYAGAQAVLNGYFGTGHWQMEIWLGNVNCIGSETHLQECHHRGWGVENCEHYQDAGVRCINGMEKVDLFYCF